VSKTENNLAVRVRGPGATQRNAAFPLLVAQHIVAMFDLPLDIVDNTGAA
jgi:hypothetical protein